MKQFKRMRDQQGNVRFYYLPDDATPSVAGSQLSPDEAEAHCQELLAEGWEEDTETWYFTLENPYIGF